MSNGGNVRPAAARTQRRWARLKRRTRAGHRLAVTRVRTLRSGIALVAVLLAFGMVLVSPLLIGDLLLQSGFIARTSTDLVEIARPTVISEQPRITLTRGTLSVPPALTGERRTGEALAAFVKGGNARLALTSPVFEVAWSGGSISGARAEDRSGDIALGLGGALSPLIAGIADATFEKLTIENGTIRLLTPTGDATLLEDVACDVIVKRKTAMRIKGTLKFRGETVMFDTTVGAKIERHGSTWLPLRAQIRSRPIQASLEGRIDWSQGPELVSSSSEISIPNVRSLARWLGQVWPSGPGLMDAVASGSLEWSKQTLLMTAGTFQVDGNEARGQLAVNLARERPDVTGTLAAATLDLTPYLPVAGGELDAGAAIIGRVKAMNDLTLTMLGMVDVDIRLSAEKVAWGANTAERGAVGINLRNAALLIDMSDLALPGGAQAHLQVTTDGQVSPPSYAVRGAVERADLARMTSALAGTDLLGGQGDISFDVTAVGASGIDALSKLNGRIAVTLAPGATVPCSVGSIVAAGKSGDGATAPSDLCHGTTALDTGTLRATLTNGVLALDPLAGKSGRDTVRLTGGMDLVTQIMTLDAEVRSSAVPSEGAPGAVSVHGRPEAPTIIINMPP